MAALPLLLGTALRRLSGVEAEWLPRKRRGAGSKRSVALKEKNNEK